MTLQDISVAIPDTALCGYDFEFEVDASAGTPAGLNDRFNPIIRCGPLDTRFRISIYNRWGQRVFPAQNMAKTWDGTFNGQACDAGTYYYVIEFDNRLTAKTRKGDLLLIR